ncbi:hypothetical protein RFN29_16215 [Mesorhizobium sp. VK22B]|uniref:ABC transporter domain-containing protein n=1 Tax=Mesorhizobium captivum TaxID=3072319 RepID=A0ABU4Z2G5_9HYPH|nr:hypothetical protein [Mesorhizobium sp. VK22B]MDX8493116.1 hypothetical protein [Mesorhizobium sp. VK22B]
MRTYHVRRTEGSAALSAAAREMQLVEIARALLIDAPVLVLDEPTASLSDSEAARLLDIMVRLRDSVASGRDRASASAR